MDVVYPNFEASSMVLNRGVTLDRPQKLSMSFDSDEQFRQFIMLDDVMFGKPIRDIEHVQLCVVGTHLCTPLNRVFRPLRPGGSCLYGDKLSLLNHASESLKLTTSFMNPLILQAFDLLSTTSSRYDLTKPESMVHNTFL